ncbi:hypothetical protein G9A89_014308 [Geosiphon pyriformis]|nr:hypothetical protein G9A89_014308 [Geosiphon pyriformis]
MPLIKRFRFIIFLVVFILVSTKVVIMQEVQAQDIIKYVTVTQFVPQIITQYIYQPTNEPKPVATNEPPKPLVAPEEIKPVATQDPPKPVTINELPKPMVTQEQQPKDIFYELPIATFQPATHQEMKPFVTGEPSMLSLLHEPIPLVATHEALLKSFVPKPLKLATYEPLLIPIVTNNQFKPFTPELNQPFATPELLFKPLGTPLEPVKPLATHDPINPLVTFESFKPLATFEQIKSMLHESSINPLITPEPLTNPRKQETDLLTPKTFLETFVTFESLKAFSDATPMRLPFSQTFLVTSETPTLTSTVAKADSTSPHNTRLSFSTSTMTTSKSTTLTVISPTMTVTETSNSGGKHLPIGPKEEYPIWLVTLFLGLIVLSFVFGMK